MIKIVTDSTCDLADEHYSKHDITVVPINIQFGTDSYLDVITIDAETFYRKVEESGMLPKTSQPSAGQFEEYYARLAAAGATDIISIHVTGKLSGTYQSAEMAKEMMVDRVRVHPFDTLSGSAGMGFMVLEAVRMVEAGSSVEEILARLEAMRDSMNVLLTVRDLRYAKMSGRVGTLQSSLSSMLRIKPIILLEDGLLDVTEKVRTQRKAINCMCDIMTARLGTPGPVNLAVVHAAAPEEGQALLEQARTMFDVRETYLSGLALSLAVQFGPGTLGLMAYRV
jgi:DegV family protein with EDD domain